jgi:RNA-directed DNA polymerase
MRRLVLGWRKRGLEQSLGTRIVTYADDLVILCRTGRAEEALQRLCEIMGKLKLTVIEEKARICRVPEGAFDFWDPSSDRRIRRGPARRTWDIGHQRRASNTRWRKSTR